MPKSKRNVRLSMGKTFFNSIALRLDSKVKSLNQHYWYRYPYPPPKMLISNGSLCYKSLSVNEGKGVCDFSGQQVKRLEK